MVNCVDYYGNIVHIVGGNIVPVNFVMKNNYVVVVDIKNIIDIKK